MEELSKLDLTEIKSLCKKHGIGIVGDKKSLIKKLNYYLEPVKGTLNTHPNRKFNDDQKIVGIHVHDREKLNSVLKKKGRFLYYSMDFFYYVVKE